MLTLDQFETRLKEEAVDSIIEDQRAELIEGGGWWKTAKTVARVALKVVFGGVMSTAGAPGSEYNPPPCDCSCNTEGCNCPT